MRKILSFLLTLLLIPVAQGVEVSRLKLDHPALGTAGGASLHSSIEAIYTKIGDNMSSRFYLLSDFDQTETVDLDHNFNTNQGDLRVELWLDTGSGLTKIDGSSTPAESDFTIVEKTGSETNILEITNNTGGDDRELVVTIFHDPIDIDDVTDVDVSTASPEDGQALVYDGVGGKWIPGASGDSSFKLQSIATNAATFKSGRIELRPDGKFLNLASDLSVNLKTEVNTQGVTAPAASTAYNVYLDLDFLPAATTSGDTDMPVYEVFKGTSGMFVVKSEEPDALNPGRYVHLARVKTDGSSDYTLLDNYPPRTHLKASAAVVSQKVARVLENNSVGLVGSQDNDYGALADSDFPTPANAAYYHLDGDANADGQAGGNLVENNSPEFDGKGFFGNENIFKTDGAGASAKTLDTFFQTNGISFSAGAWVKVLDTTVDQILMAQEFSTGDRSWQINLDQTGTRTIVFSGTNTAGSYDSNSGYVVPDDYDFGEYHHIVFVYDSVADEIQGYVDGVLQYTDSISNIRNLSSQIFEIGAKRDGTGGPSNALIHNAFFTKDALTEAQVNALYSKRFKGQQIAAGHILDADSFNYSDLTDRVSFYNFAADSNDGSVNAHNLSAAGGATAGGELNIFGEVGATKIEAGSSEAFQVNDPFFTDHNSFTAGLWVKKPNWQQTNAVFMSVWDSSDNNRRWVFQTTTGDVLRITTSSDGTSGTNEALDVDIPTLDGTWHHLVARVKDQEISMFYDGELVGQRTISAVMHGATGKAFTGSFSNQTFQDVFYAQQALSDDEIRKIYSARLDLTGDAAAVDPANMMLQAHYRSEDLQVKNDFDQGWLIDKRPGKLYVDFGQVPGHQVTLDMFDSSIGEFNTVSPKTYSQRFTATPAATIAHGLPETPTAFAILHDENADGQFAPLPVSSYIKADATNLYISGLGGLTIDATHPLKIIAAVGSSALALDVNALYFEAIEVSAAADMANRGEYLARSDTAAFTLTLPASANTGDRIRVTDAGDNAATNNITVDRNGHNINGAASNFVVDVDKGWVEFVYVNATLGWITKF